MIKGEGGGLGLFEPMTEQDRKGLRLDQSVKSGFQNIDNRRPKS